MKIVLVNWARIWDGANYGGGVNGYCQSLALAMVARGHEVTSLFGGISFVPPRLAPVKPTPDAPAGCFIRRHNDWLGVRVFEVLNSPVMAPSIVQYQEPLGEVSSPELERQVGRLFEMLKPDIVHFHNIEGFSIGCVDAARAVGAGVIFSLHNYHTICPQVYLMKLGRVACHDSRGGRDCAACMAGMRAPAEERAHRASYHTVRVEPVKPAPTFGERVREMFSPTPPPPPPVLVFPGRPAEVFTDILPDEGSAREPEVVQGPARAVDPAELVPLSNDPHPDPSDSGELNEYGQRRRAMVEMLGRCDRVVAVSSFVQKKFEAMGVPARVLRTLMIGTRMADVVRGAAPEPPLPFDAQQPRAVKAVFLGYNNYYKGLPMLADALELVEPGLLARLHLCVYAKAVEEILPRLDALEPRMAGLSIRSGYTYEEIPSLLRGKDVGLVPSVWWDNGPQTVMEFFACGLPVIGANLGGIPDMLRHGVNGLLFRGNDRGDLARTLEGVLREPSQLMALRAGVRPPRGMGEHVTDIERIYAECLAER